MKEAEEVFATTLDNLEQQAKAENIEIFNRQIFKDDPSAAIQNLKRQVVIIVIITSTYNNEDNDNTYINKNSDDAINNKNDNNDDIDDDDNDDNNNNDTKITNILGCSNNSWIILPEAGKEGSL